MENGKKVALGVTALMLALVGLRVGLIYKANHEEAPAPKPAYEPSAMTASVVPPNLVTATDPPAAKV